MSDTQKPTAPPVPNDNVDVDIANPENLKAITEVANAGLFLAGSLKRAGLLDLVQQGSELHMAMSQMEFVGAKLLYTVNETRKQQKGLNKATQELLEKATVEREKHSQQVGWDCSFCGQMNYSPADAGCENPNCPTREAQPSAPINYKVKAL